MDKREIVNVWRDIKQDNPSIAFMIKYGTFFVALNAILGSIRTAILLIAMLF